MHTLQWRRPTGLTARRSGRRCAARATTGNTHAKIDPAELLITAKKAAALGGEVVTDALGKPKNISRKDGTDIVTETDAAAESAIVQAILSAYPGHAVLGEEGGVKGDVNSDYLWVIDPLDGTVNFAQGISNFNVSVGVLRHATPVAGCVVEFTGLGKNWRPHVFSAHRNGGAFLDGQQIFVSPTKAIQDAVVATELVWYDEDIWKEMSGALKDWTKEARGVRMSGAAAANLCHLALGTIDTYYQINLKPWDAAAGAVIAEEAGARLSTIDGVAWSVFDRSLLATNDALYEKALALLEPRHEALHDAGVQLGQWHVPKGYRVRAGRQMDS